MKRTTTWLRALVPVLCLASTLSGEALAAPPPNCDVIITPATQTGPDGVLYTLDGSLSKPVGLVTYQWTQIGTPSVTINNATSGIATFLAPTVGPAGQTLQFQLKIAGCNTTGNSGKDVQQTTVTLRHLVTNLPPTAVASASPATASEGQLVTLTGTQSSDPENAALTYHWTQTDGPVVVLANPNAAVTTFVAPNVADSNGATFQFTLTVSDGTLANTSPKVSVSVLFNNDTPVASLTCPELVNEGGQIVLDASGSLDYEDGTNLHYAWMQVSGTPSVPGSALAVDGPVLTFSAPAMGLSDEGFVPFQVSVSDSGLLVGTAVCTVQIRDNTAPVIQVADITAQATSSAGASVSYAPVTSDNVDGSMVAACDPTSPHQFTLGSHLVSCSAGDSSVPSNVGTASFSVNVVDTIAPVIAAHDDVLAEATGPSGASVNYTSPTTSDAVDGAGVATCAPASGSVFAIASTLVTCNASDAHSNAATPRTFSVIVRDSTAPGITPPADVTKEATAAMTPVDYGMATGTDAVGPVTITSDAPASGLFPVGTTDITWTATDGHNNSTIAHSFVTVTDETPPSVDAVDDQVLEATSAAGAVATFDAPAAHDLVDGLLATTCDHTSGATFPLGDTTVTCSVEDAHHNPGSTTFTITVQDTTDPTVTVPGDITKEATSAAGASASFSSTAEDIVDGTVATTCTPASGSTFALGATLVTCSATDHAGNTGSATFNVIVEDTTAPTVNVPANMTVEATGSTGGAASFSATASDIVDGALAASCTPASGSTFALGTTLVTCSATDHADNTGTASFNVTVVDTTAPALTLPGNQTAEATGPSGAAVSWTASASDLVDGSVMPVCTPASGSTFAIATTTVNCSATDHAGNTASGSFNVTVRDTTKPTIAYHPDVLVNATSGAGALVTYTNPTATDLVDGTVAVTCSPASGTQFALGSTTVTCTATDSHNNTQTSSFTVIVSFNFSGFFKPIDNLPIVNVVKAGQAIPVKFSLGGNMGLNIFAAGYPASIATACNANPQDAVEETVTAGGSSLSYDATTGQYIYVWKTDKAWAGACRQLVVKLADGSTTKVAMFNFTR